MKVQLRRSGRVLKNEEKRPINVSRHTFLLRCATAVADTEKGSQFLQKILRLISEIFQEKNLEFQKLKKIHFWKFSDFLKQIIFVWVWGFFATFLTFETKKRPIFF